jgi:hypothetical protein
MALAKQACMAHAHACVNVRASLYGKLMMAKLANVNTRHTTPVLSVSALRCASHTGCGYAPISNLAAHDLGPTLTHARAHRCAANRLLVEVVITVDRLIGRHAVHVRTAAPPTTAEGESLEASWPSECTRIDACTTSHLTDTPILAPSFLASTQTDTNGVVSATRAR